MARRDIHNPFFTRISDAERAALEAAAFGEVPTPGEPGPPVVAGDRPLPTSAPRLIGVVGAPHSGKDVIADHLIARYAGVGRLAFSDVIIAEANRWLEAFGRRIDVETKSDPTYRLLLQTFGVVRRREDERYWVDQVASRIRRLWSDGVRLVVTTGVRAPSDSELIRDLGGELWRVRRPGHSSDASMHPIERMLDDLPDSDFDAVLINGVEGDLAPYIAEIERTLHSPSGR